MDKDSLMSISELKENDKDGEWRKAGRNKDVGE